MVAIRKNVQTMFEDFLSTSWVDKIENHLKTCFLELSDKNADLGLPMPSLHVYKEALSVLNTMIPFVYPLFQPNLLTVIEENEFRGILTTTVNGLIKNCKWVKLQSCDCWAAISGINQKIDSYSIGVYNELDTVIAECDAKNLLSHSSLLMVVNMLVLFTNGDNSLCKKIMDNLLDRNVTPESEIKIAKPSIFQRTLSFVLNTFRIEQLPDVCKFDRFPKLVKSFEDYVGVEISKSLKKFEDKAKEYISNNGDVLDIECAIECAQIEKCVQGALKWKSDCKIHTSNIIFMYMKEVVHSLPTITEQWIVPESCLEESCTTERLQILNQMADITKALTSLLDLKARAELVGQHFYILTAD